ncbi:MAG: lipopolysaccharide biosynthesis protein [Armatimonadota bacterium]
MEDQTLGAQTTQRVTSEDSKRNFFRNTASNIIFFVFNAVTSLVMVPYVIRNLGWENFGIIGVAQQFVTYTQILTIVLVGTVFRFVTMCIAKDDIDGARSYFNTNFVSVLAFAALFLPITGLISYLTPAILKNIPPGKQANIQVLFFLVYMSFILGLISNPYRVGQFVRQRFDARNIIEIGSQVIRYGTWFVLFGLFTPTLWHIGLGYVLGSLELLIANAVSFYRLTPELHPSVREFSRPKFNEMTKMGSWLIVSQIGVVLYLSVDSLIITRMIGPGAFGKYNTILGLAIQLRGLSTMMCSLVVPVAIASYARNDWNALIRNSSRAVRFVSIGMAVPLAILCGLAGPFLTRWLGPEVVRILTPLVWLLLAHNVINCGVEPLFALSMAANRVAVPGIVTVVGGIVKVLLSIVLVKYTNLGFYGVAIAGLVSLTLKNSIFTPLYSGRILKSSSVPFFKALAPSVLVFGVVSLIASVLAKHVFLATYPRLFVAGTLLLVLSGLGVYFLALGKDDRAFIRRLRKREQEVIE